ncbi:ABC transporter permease [Nocardioides ultimimeridianus]
MGALLAWARLDVRRRWRSLAGLTLLVAVSTGTVAAVVVGAHRGATALDRLLAVTEPATADVTPNLPHFDWSSVARLPYVEAVDPTVLTFSEGVAGVPPTAIDWPVTTDARFHSLERPVVLAGRLPDPTSADEVAITQRFADLYGYAVGDTIQIRMMSRRQMEQPQNPAFDDLAGPRPQERIVGIVRAPWADTQDRLGRLETTRGFFRRYRAYLYDGRNFSTPLNALVRLRDGEADLPQLRTDLARLTGRTDINVVNLAADHEQYSRSLRIEATWLLAFAGAAAIAGLVIVGQALDRSAATGAADLRRAAALGLTPRQRFASALLVPGAALVTGLALAVPFAIAASPLFPFGLATDVEPDPGVAVDPAVLLGTLAAFGALLAGFVVLGARATSRREVPRTRPGLAARLRSWGVAAPISTGVHHALDPGTRTSPTPVRTAIVASVAAVAGMVGALSVAAGLHDASGHPERFGETWQFAALTGFNGTDLAPYDEVVATLRALPYTASVAAVELAVATADDGLNSVSIWSTDGGLRTVMTTGRMPSGPGEIALAPSTSRQLGAGIGDTVQLAGDGPEQSYRVTGTGFVPSSIQTTYASGAWVTPDGFTRLFHDRWGLHLAFATTRPGTPAAGLNDRLLTDFQAARPDLYPRLAGLGADHEIGFNTEASVERTQEVRALPWAFAGFVALLGLGAIAHAVGANLRRRRTELAVMRAVGMTPRQTAATILTQALTIGLIGLGVGVPLGFVLGHATWRLVAQYTPLQFVPPSVAAAIAIASGAALLIALLPAVLPALRASRIDPAATLRSE